MVRDLWHRISRADSFGARLIRLAVVRGGRICRSGKVTGLDHGSFDASHAGTAPQAIANVKKRP